MSFVSIGDAAERVVKSTKAKRAKVKTKEKTKAESPVFNVAAQSGQPVMVNLARVNDADFRMRLPYHLRSGLILCQPGRFVEV